MKREITPNFVSDVIPFSYATSEWLENQPGRPIRGCTLGQISKDGKWAWLSNGPSLEVVSTETGERLGAGYFSIDSKSFHNSITCACELNSSNGTKLVIGLECGNHGGLLVVFDIKTSKVIRGITMPYQVTSVEAVSSAGGANYSNHVLHRSLRFMYGIVAVGLVGCNLFLVDLCLDDDAVTNDIHPNSLQYINQEDPDIQFKRAEAIMHHNHFCISLNDSTAYHGSFTYKATKANKPKNFSADDVSVTSMKYVSHLQSIVVGYSFGAFHIWNLNKLALDHASRFEWGQPPVIDFVYQEPENDPRNFCYLWVVRGIPQLDLRQDKVTYIALHALMYSNKSWQLSIGNVYEDLNSCSVSFEFDLTCDPYSVEDTGTSGSRLLGCYALGDDSSQLHMDDSSQDEGIDSSTHSLMVVMWEAWSQESQTRFNGFIGIFDLNQWYQSQMPGGFSVTAGMELCQYLGFFTLSEVMDHAAPDFMLHGQVDRRSVSLLQMTSHAEQNFFPSSLAFKISCIIETGVIHASYLGLQRQILADLKRMGPSVLIEPREVFNLCIFSGLLPKSLEMPTSNTSPQIYHREAVLSIALEHNMIDFIISCATEWACREFSGVGCSTRFVLDWAWKKAGQIKASLDKLCVTLYNCSGMQLDKAKLQYLHHSITQLSQLSTLLQHLAAHWMPIMDQGLRDLDTKLNIVSLIHMHYVVVLWFYKAGLLPEHDEQPEMSDEEFAFPANLLKETFIHRRQELQRIDSMIRGTELLLIDGIISHIGEPITSLWEKDGGTGLYPPPSLYALLNIYLLGSAPLVTKHRIVQYLFLDVAACFPEGSGAVLVNRLTAFPTAFAMKMSIHMLTYAFWLLDHKDFEGAISVLLDPVINVTDIEPWQNTLIIKAFLYQNEPQKALKYFVARRPAMATPEDMQLRLSVLLANGLIAEAFKFQRENRDQNTASHLLKHFFLACQQKKRLGTLFQLPLSPAEEEALVHFLQESREPYAQEMLVMYYLQRSRFVQALTINDRLRSRVMVDCDPSSRERSATRNIIVDGYANVLPKMQQKLSHSAEFQLHHNIVKKEISRPQPLSTVVKWSNAQVTSQATLIRAVLAKVSETSVTQQKMELFSPFCFGAQRKADPVTNADNLPFVCTPMTSRNRFQQKDATELVYPNVLTRETELHESPMECRVSPSKRSRYMDVNPTKRRTPKYASGELMSILQTPPVRRKTPVSRSQPFQNKNEEEFIAPQSILKVRQMGQIILSSSSATKTDFTVLADSTSDPNEEKMDFSIEFDDADYEQDLLPKQIRFELSDSAHSSPPSEKEDDELMEKEVMMAAKPCLNPRLLPDRQEIAERVSKTKLLLRSAISYLAHQEIEVSSSPLSLPHSEFNFREPLVPQERAVHESMENISPLQLSVSPRRPLRSTVEQPVVFAPPKEVLEPDSSGHSPTSTVLKDSPALIPSPAALSISPTRVTSSIGKVESPTAVPAHSPSVQVEIPSSANTTGDDIAMPVLVTSPLPTTSDDEMPHLELETSNSISSKEVVVHVIDTIVSESEGGPSTPVNTEFTIKKRNLEQPYPLLLQTMSPKQKTPEPEKSRSCSPDNSSSYSKFLTPESQKSSPICSVQTVHSHLSSETSASPTSFLGATPPSLKSSLCSTGESAAVTIPYVATVLSTASSIGSPNRQASSTISLSFKDSMISAHSKSHPSTMYSQTVSSMNSATISIVTEHSSATETVQQRLRSATSSGSPISLRSQMSILQSPSVSIRASTPEDSPVSVASKGSQSLVPQVNLPSPVLPTCKDTEYSATSTMSSPPSITPLVIKGSLPASTTTHSNADPSEPADENVRQEDTKIVSQLTTSPRQLRPRSRNCVFLQSDSHDVKQASPVSSKDSLQSMNQAQVTLNIEPAEERMEIEVETSTMNPALPKSRIEIEADTLNMKSVTPKLLKDSSVETQEFRHDQTKVGHPKTDTTDSDPVDSETGAILNVTVSPLDVIIPEASKKKLSKSSSVKDTAERSTRQTPRLIAVTAPKARTVASKMKAKTRTPIREGKGKPVKHPSPNDEVLPKTLTGSLFSSKRTVKPTAVHLLGKHVHTYNTRLRSGSPESATSSPSSKDGDIPVTKSTPEKKKLPESKEKPATKAVRRPLTRATASSNKRNSGASVVEENIKYSFSPPTAVPGGEIMGNTPMTHFDSKPFIFSPPLTRARTRRGKRLSETDIVSNEAAAAAATDYDSGPSTCRTSDQAKKSSGRVAGKKAVPRSRRLVHSPDAVGSDTPINFISPVEMDKTEKSTTSTRQSQRSSLAAGAHRRSSVFGHSRKKANIW